VNEGPKQRASSGARIAPLVCALVVAVFVCTACSSTGGAEETGRGGAPGGQARSGACVRPYADDSPWNTPIRRDAAYDPEGESYLRRFTEVLTSDPSQYTYPVYEVSAETPRRTVELSGWYSNVIDGGRTLTNQRRGTAELPIPAGAEAAAGTDAQIILLDPSTGDEWGVWQLERAGDAWRATNAYHYNTRWSGVPPRDANGQPFFSRGAGVPYLAGLVRPCEIERGRIDHALAFAYDAPSPEYVYPATKSDGAGGPDDLPEGARLQLDPALSDREIRGWGCTAACLVIARALQEYGMYVVDNSGRAKVIVEYEGTARWNGGVDENTVSPIPLRAFRALRSEVEPS
jgi:hypothetical protein